MKLSKGLIFSLIVAVILRIIIAGITYHPDIAGQLLSSYFFAYENVVNVYDHLVYLPSMHPLVKNFGVGDIFIYPPLTYFTLGSFLKIFSPIVPQQFFIDLMNGISIYTLPNLSFSLILFKLPYLLIDILMAFLLASLFDDKKQKKWIFLLWLFNPITFYATSMMGVFDIIPVIFTVLAVYFAKKKNLYLAAVMLSISAAYKQYPLFLLPFVVVAGKDWVDRIKIAVCGVVPYFLTIAPFLSSSAFKAMVFGPKSQKMFYMQWMLSGGEGLFPYLLGYVYLFWHAVKNINLNQKIWKYFLSFCLILLVVTHFHPQWFIWVSPFLAIELVANRWKNLWLTLTIFACYLAIVFTFDNSLNVGLFAVASPDLSTFVGIDKLITQKTDINFFKSAVRSVLAATSIFLILDVFRAKGRGNIR